MSTRKSFLPLFLLLIILLAACQGSKASPVEAPEQQAPENQSEPEESQADQETEPQEAPDEEQETAQGEFLSCPTSGESLTLGFDHAVTIEQEGVNLTHILREGMLMIVVGEQEADGTISLSSVAGNPLTYEMMGIMGECSVEMSGQMDVSASGFCNDGVVYLTIVETWQSASGMMTCDDNTIPFNTPGPGAFVHEGADGAGEVFYLVDSSEGYTVMREFGMGSGFHSWTLYASRIDTVPLVP